MTTFFVLDQSNDNAIYDTFNSAEEAKAYAEEIYNFYIVNEMENNINIVWGVVIESVHHSNPHAGFMEDS